MFGPRETLPRTWKSNEVQATRAVQDINTESFNVTPNYCPEAVFDKIAKSELDHVFDTPSLRLGSLGRPRSSGSKSMCSVAQLIASNIAKPTFSPGPYPQRVIEPDVSASAVRRTPVSAAAIASDNERPNINLVIWGSGG